MVVKHISQNCSISLSFGVNETISETHHLATSIATMLRGSPMICGDRHMHSRPRLHGCPRSRITSELCSWSYLIPVFLSIKNQRVKSSFLKTFLKNSPWNILEVMLGWRQEIIHARNMLYFSALAGSFHSESLHWNRSYINWLRQFCWPCSGKFSPYISQAKKDEANIFLAKL